MLLLYPDMPSITKGEKSTLHSTMLLLYLRMTFNPVSSSHLYIPLCFYYIKCQIYYCYSGYSFTFHYASTISKTQWIKTTIKYNFTFHYASTISVKNRLSVLTHSAFTFHYASTISNNPRSVATAIKTLHSTMLLLYLDATIPNIVAIAFTFHYASTISTVPGCTGCSIVPFTFHYASTISHGW